MHPIDENEVRGCIRPVVAPYVLEVLVARHRHDDGCFRDIDVDLGRWIHADGWATRERKAVAAPHTDLQVAIRLEGLVKRSEHIDIREVACQLLFIGRALSGEVLARSGPCQHDRPPRRISVLKDAHEVVPGAAFVDPPLDQLTTGVLGQSLVRVREESIAVNWIPVHRSGGRRDDEQQAVILEDADHFLERAPEERAVLEHLARDDDVDLPVAKRQEVGVR